MSSDEENEEPAPERDVHETLLPSLHLSVLGGVGLAEQLTPLPASLSQPPMSLPPTGTPGTPSTTAASGIPIIVEESGSRPRGARAGG